MNTIEYAYLETTNYCNLDCSFCNRKEVIGSLQHMSLETFQEVLQRLSGHPIKECKLMGMGEPFLHPQFDEICRLFKEEFPDATLIVATNCQYRIRDSFKKALQYIDILYFSIDGYGVSYERDRAPAKWSKLMNFLEEFKELDRHDCNVVCNYVVNPDNIEDIPKVQKDIIDVYDLGELRLNIAQNWSEDETMIGGYSEEQISHLKTNYRHLVKGKSPWTWSDCFWVNNAIYMTVEGNVKVCCMNTSAKSLGNILEQPIEWIHSNLEYDEIRKGCAEDKPTDHCANCSYKELSPLLGKIIGDA